MPSITSHPVRTVLILSACQSPGPQLARAFADAGSRVIVMGGDAQGLARIADASPDRIEPLFVKGGQVEALRVIATAWGAEPIDLVINLMPLAYPKHITEQMRGLSMIMQSFGRGLMAGKGALVSVAARPGDTLALVEQGMCVALAEAGTALGDAVASKSMRVHTVMVPKKAPERALDTLLFLGGAPSRHIKSTTFDLAL